MKRVIIYLLMLLLPIGSSISMSASEFDFLRAISALGKGAQAYILTNDDIKDIVRQSITQLDAQNKVAPANSKYSQRLKRLTANLKKVGGTPLNFKVYITNDVNAFACADGSVRVYSGIMDLMTDNELLGIIGHEIGHVGMEHSYKAIKNELINSAIIDAAGAVSSTIATLSDYQLLAIGEVYLSSRYSRKQEREADNYGYNFLKKNGKNPYYMVMAFEKMQSLEDKYGSTSKIGKYFNRMFSSHPETAERIKNLKARCKKEGYSRPK